LEKVFPRQTFETSENSIWRMRLQFSRQCLLNLIYASEYSLYLPGKTLLQQKLNEWMQEFEDEQEILAIARETTEQNVE
jgi:predicted ribonuclease YlaK